MISVALLVATIAVLWNIHKTKQYQQQMRQLIKDNQETERNIIQALNQICEVLNKSFATGAAYMNDSGFALMNIAVCMIPFIDDIKECAIEEEDYKKAQECVNILKNLKQITKPISYD